MRHTLVRVTPKFDLESNAFSATDIPLLIYFAVMHITLLTGGLASTLYFAEI